MNALHSILRRTHCRSTHHLFAIDAIELVQTDAGKRLASWLLRYHHQYLAGATDPDRRMRDFQNHIIHVEDGYWGGAPRVAHQWYNRMQRRLMQGRFADAAQAAGILSHYFTDPMHPLHTGQTKREALVHRPLERSVYQSYDEIRQRWIDDDLRIVFQLGDGPDWLGTAMLHGARYAHQKFALLVNSYRFDEGIEDPPAGLDGPSRVALAELFGLAITGWARVIERAAADVESVMRHPLPMARYAQPTALALLRSPFRLWRAHAESKREQRKISALAHEYRSTGRLVEHLPAEVDIKQRVIEVYKSEQLYRADRDRRAAAKLARLQPQPPENQDGQIPDAPTELQSATGTESTYQVDTPTHAAAGDAASGPTILPFATHLPASTRLAGEHPIYSAPSISDVTANKLYGLGIRTVSEFVSADPSSVANRLHTYWIDREMIARWQVQSSLMCQIGALREVDVQLLSGAGFCTVNQIALSDARLIHSEVLRYALTSAGRRYSRGQAAVTIDAVKCWVDAARRVLTQTDAHRRA
ncbi:MAG: DUF4332 domain-containing protein [Pirellulaceae bacterium]|nr:DUF4332 domain-containing protein [Pirellulaceae bacterium]